MPEESMENMFQLAFIDILFQVIGLFLNLFVAVFQGVSTSAIQGVFDAIGGAAM